MSLEQTFQSLSFCEKLQLLDNLQLNCQLELICLFLTDCDADLRARAIEVLSRFKYTEYLVFKINDESAVVREAVARECGKHEMIPELKVLVFDDDTSVSETAILQLSKLGYFVELAELGNRTNNCYIKIRINNELKRNF